MAIPQDKLSAAREALKKAQENPPQIKAVTKQAAINELKREIMALRKIGYGFDEISKILTNAGIQVSTATLKSYLQRTNKDKEKPKQSEDKKAKTSDKEKKQTPPKIDDEQKPASTGKFEVKPDTEV